MILKKIINSNKVYIIAEIGVNHNGSLAKAKKLILYAKKSGANAVKFQNFQAESLATKFAPKANYQIKNTKNNESQFSMLKRLQLKPEDYYIIKNFCKRNHIDFLSSPFDNESLEFLKNKLRLKIIKIPSGEINNFKLLNNLKTSSIILSTGMSTEIEIANAINFIYKKKIFIIRNKKILIFNKKYLKKIFKRIILLHCVTDYPVKDKFANLMAISSLSKTFKLTIGYSDHTLGILAPIIAVALGSKVIEKHFTLNKSDLGPDHKASLEPKEFKLMVNFIRQTEILKGNGLKKVEFCEKKNIKIARKSLVSKSIIKKNELFNLKNLEVKRPGTGIPANEYFNYLGKKAKRDFLIDELIK